MQDHCQQPPGKTPVVVYDRSDVDRVSGLTLRERLAACYRWADARGYEVIEEFVVGQGTHADSRSSITDMITLCASGATSLLIYSPACVTKDAGLFHDVLSRLGDSLMIVQPVRDAAQALLPERAL